MKILDPKSKNNTQMKIIQYTRHITTVLLLTLFSLASFAQDGVAQKVKKMKVGFLTEKLELTQDEAQDFWPVYNEYMDKKEAIVNKYKNNDDADAMVDQKSEEATLLKEYNDKFKKVLPNDKVGRLHKAEKEFKSILLKELKKRQNEE